MTTLRGRYLTLAAIGLGGAALMAALPAVAAPGVCRDPWITQAVREVTGRAPNGEGEGGDCTYTQYGGGHWSSYQQLKGFVQQRLGAPSLSYNRSSGITAATFRSLPKRTYNGVPQALYNGQWLKIGPAGLITNDGGTIMTNAGGN